LEKKIFLEFDLQKSKSEVINPIYIPFSVHDYIHRCFLKDREILLKNPRNTRMLFAGAFHGYKGKNISVILGKMEREEVVQIYRNHPNVISIETQNQLDKILTAPATNHYYWIDTDVFRIPGSRWLEVLSHVEVFLCPPGVVNPMSYNSNEAMAMGAIPLINYPEWFHPSLENQKNCFVFSNKEDLLEGLDHISKLSQEQLSSIRSNLMTYFMQYQSDEAVLKKINEFEDVLVITFIMNVEQEIYKAIQPTALAVDIDKK